MCVCVCVCLQVFQCLLIDGENAGEEALKEAERFVISELQFQDFLDKHSSVSCLVAESNEKVGGATTTCATHSRSTTLALLAVAVATGCSKLVTKNLTVCFIIIPSYFTILTAFCSAQTFPPGLATPLLFFYFNVCFLFSR